jgi:hypothetical protein
LDNLLFLLFHWRLLRKYHFSSYFLVLISFK